ncbi:type II CRISPR RNA-guided endonuclease Cas9 [Faecalibacterium sp. An192]|uniref:type II CRISPR RNA-guided endonuclease Cas9 n=1 Tax=Faecalibacterium sp. An192 TaxID=1965581 RepID=UPI000B3AB276|nr:type II CRISPR RNA-guided endonuclease Cas9 [Faecalibacterium sp. An192]OUP26129.1 type II CRISPR RNA-guided endonuclease Cas9 [Faecalibacterium sp. An192]
MHYILGLDVGIQSVGWAVIRYDEPARIEDFGVRIFDTTENQKSKDNTNQERRAFRAARRVLRRRSHRRAMVKRHLQRIGLLREGEVEAFFESGQSDPLRLRVKGLTEQLTPAELAACLIHISNHRGYQAFYNLTEEELKELPAAERKEYQQERSGIELVEGIMEQGHYRSVAEMLLTDDTFAPDHAGPMRVYRSHPYLDTRYPISRDLLRKEADAILTNQARFYPCLNAPYQTTWRKESKTTTNRAFLEWLIFTQRDFEDGPGDRDDAMRKYTGFLQALGKCPFYREEDRGPRMTVLGDLYALTNSLSQYQYMNTETGVFELPKELAEAMLAAALRDAELPAKKIQELAKRYHIKVDNKAVKTADRAPNCIKFLRRVRPILEKYGINWETALGGTTLEDVLADDTMLNQIGRVLSLYQTPHRRQEELVKIPGISPELAKRLTAERISGTAKVSAHYMRDAVEAFQKGERYGEFQWRRMNELEQPLPGQASGAHVKLPPFPVDAEFAKNSVVMRSLNETRKIINAIVGQYGSPWAVNVEVASDLGRSWAERAELDRRNKQNEAQTEKDKQQICQIMGYDSPDQVKGSMVERFQLAQQQNWQCLYTGRPITDKRAALDPKNKGFEVDHIVPFSMILDNTLQNKALVYADANQTKGQRTPLMYLRDPAQREQFIGRVNQMAKNHIISDRKRQYLLLADLYHTDLLDEWKSRNLNDTRYIAKYLRGYLERELAPAPEHRTPFVFPVKGGLTSRFRRTWLNRSTWGGDEKSELRESTTLHHAVDAVVIANISPATAQIAEDNLRLNRILKNSRGIERPEYRAQLERSLQTLEQFYHVPRTRGEACLKRQNRITALIANLNIEVDIRFGVPGQTTDPDSYRSLVTNFYADDPDFAARLTQPLTSRKPERKLQGTLTTANALGTKEIDGVLYEAKRTDVMKLTQKNLSQLCTNDGDLRDSLAELLADAGTRTLADVLSEQGKTEFRTQKGQLIRKVTLKGSVVDQYKIKQIAPNNYSVLDTTSYYCTEVYRDPAGKTRVRAIARASLVCKGKKLWLTCPNPADYAEHIMYLFKNDYIRVETPNGLQFEGFYQSPAGIKQAKFNGIKNNDAKSCPFHISGGAVVKKYDISILGRKGGEIPCGEPLSLLLEKK